jgi:hypothetical protein
MFRATLRPSSGAREYYTVCCRLRSLVLGFQVVSMVWSWGFCVRFASWNKKHLLHLVGILFPHINDDARSKSLQKYIRISIPITIIKKIISSCWIHYCIYENTPLYLFRQLISAKNVIFIGYRARSVLATDQQLGWSFGRSTTVEKQLVPIEWEVGRAPESG